MQLLYRYLSDSISTADRQGQWEGWRDRVVNGGLEDILINVPLTRFITIHLRRVD